MQVVTLAHDSRGDASRVAGTAAVQRGGWLSSRHSLPVELAMVLGLYAVYEATRGLVAGDAVFPTAPPRLSDLGVLDTVSGGHVDLNKGLVSSLYNPYAAVPSMHVGYALIVGASLARYAPHPLTRLAGLAYPPFVLLV